jgi:beta-1,4-mannosyltransferase
MTGDAAGAIERRFYRPAPSELEGNKIYALMLDHLSQAGYEPLDFPFWNPLALFANRNRCRIIHTHWPEGIWRSGSAIACYLLALRFVLVYAVSRALGYRWVWSAHNVIPHYQVRSALLERMMRLFVLRHFNLVIGHAYNTRNDLELAFGTSGRAFVLALLGTYEDAYPVRMSRTEVRQRHGLPQGGRLLLIMNTHARANKGVLEFLESWAGLGSPGNVHLVLTGTLPDLGPGTVLGRNFHHIEGRIPDEDLGGLLGAVDFLVVNYTSITTSSVYTLALTFGLPVIAPNLPFFSCHATERTALFLDHNTPVAEQLSDMVGRINDGWRADSTQLQALKSRHSQAEAARRIAAAFRVLEV